MIRELLEEKPYLKKTVLIILIAIVLVILAIILVPLIIGKKINYNQLENKMENAAINYYDDNKDKLPEEGNSITLQYNVLVDAKKIKPIEKYLGKNTSCSGKVVVNNSNNNYSYTAYLDCGNDYKTTELYNKILQDNEIITSSDGLYIQGDSKVFRGESLNNYVSLDGNLWRIVKIDSDNNVKLILDNSDIKSLWDNRYNSEQKSSYGKNTYSLSRLKEESKFLYDGSKTLTSGKSLLSEDVKSKLISKPICVGQRSINDNVNDNSIECSETLEGEYISSLTLSEYVTASIDPSCVLPTSKECQNYNYLVSSSNTSWWLLTTVKDNTHQAYFVNSFGYSEIANCSSYYNLRPTIYLGSNTKYSSGTGKSSDPYLIK